MTKTTRRNGRGTKALTKHFQPPCSLRIVCVTHVIPPQTPCHAFEFALDFGARVSLNMKAFVLPQRNAHSAMHVFFLLNIVTRLLPLMLDCRAALAHGPSIGGSLHGNLGRSDFMQADQSRRVRHNRLEGVERRLGEEAQAVYLSEDREHELGAQRG